MTSATPTPEFTPIPATFDRVFNTSHDWTATLSADRVRTLVATGDVLLARQVNILIQQKNNPHWPFEKTVDLLTNADVTYINLETPLIANCPISNSGFVFCGDTRNVQGLLFAGVDVVNVANNHASNYGEDGVEETVQLLERNNMIVSGVHGPVYKTIRGVTFGFVGYNEVNKQAGIADTADEERMRMEIQQARQIADVLVVQFHWGVEYTHQPTTNQRRLARFAIDQGADIVIGNHPHWYQAVEFYRNKFIMYSHGNFIFDQMWSQKTREGVVGKYTFYDSELIDVEFIPIFIEEYGQPRIIADQKHQESILRTLRDESTTLLPN